MRASRGVILLLNIFCFFPVFLVGACAVVDGGFQKSTYWHAEDLREYLQKSHPIGSSEASLIEDFSKHGFKYSKECQGRMCLNAPSYGSRGNLAVEAHCSWFTGGQKGVEINWYTDREGNIANILSNDTMCLLTP